MQNSLGLFIQGFLLHFSACFNIVYLDYYIICENAFFSYSKFSNILAIVNLNQIQPQPSFFVISFM